MPDASHDFGAHLRQAREQRGVSLREIADRTKISVLALEALERNDVSRLPGGIFTRAFVRSYAAEVGLDPEDTVRRFLARFPDESSDEVPDYDPNPDRISVEERPTFGRAWRAVAWSIPLLLVVGYFGFGGRLPWWGDPVPQTAARTSDVPKAPPPPASSAAVAAQGANPLPPEQPRTPATGEPAATQASGVRAGEPGAAQTAVAPSLVQGARGVQGAPAAGQGAPGAAQGSVPGEPHGAALPRTAPAATSGGQPVEAAPQAAVPAATPDASASGTFRLTLAPREACWVSVRSNGASVYSSLMRAGERQDLVLRGDVSLTVGNAGAFVYLINDQPGRTLGGPGQVTTVRLNADNAKTFIEPR